MRSIVPSTSISRRTLMGCSRAGCLPALAAADGAQRVALVIGNAAYAGAPLPNATPASIAEDGGAADGNGLYTRFLVNEIQTRRFTTRVTKVTEELAAYMGPHGRDVTSASTLAGAIITDGGATYNPPCTWIAGGEFQVGKRWSGRSLRLMNNGNGPPHGLVDASRVGRAGQAGDRRAAAWRRNPADLRARVLVGAARCLIPHAPGPACKAGPARCLAARPEDRRCRISRHHPGTDATTLDRY